MRTHRTRNREAQPAPASSAGEAPGRQYWRDMNFVRKFGRTW